MTADDKIIQAAKDAIKQHDPDRLYCTDHRDYCCPAGDHNFKSYYAHLAEAAVAAVEPLIREQVLHDHELANGGCVPTDAYRDAERHIREQIAQEIEDSIPHATFNTAEAYRVYGLEAAAKIARGSVPDTDDEPVTEVVDLVAALRGSIEAAKQRRAEAEQARGGDQR